MRDIEGEGETTDYILGGEGGKLGETKVRKLQKYFGNLGEQKHFVVGPWLHCFRYRKGNRFYIKKVFIKTN